MSPTSTCLHVQINILGACYIQPHLELSYQPQLPQQDHLRWCRSLLSKYCIAGNIQFNYHPPLLGLRVVRKAHTVDYGHWSAIVGMKLPCQPAWRWQPSWSLCCIAILLGMILVGHAPKFFSVLFTASMLRPSAMWQAADKGPLGPQRMSTGWK